MDVSYPSLLFIIFLLLVVSAFFSAAETGFVASSKEKIYRLKMEGNKKAVRLLELLDKKQEIMTIVLLGNNGVNILASTIAAGLFIKIFGQDKGIVIASVLMTIVIVVFCEILPKVLVLQYAEKTAFFATPIFSALIKILHPLTLLLDYTLYPLIKVLGLKHITDVMREMSGNEALRGAIALHHKEGRVVKTDRDMLDGVLDLVDTEVHEIMTYRKDVLSIDINDNIEDITTKVIGSSYSRIPVYKKDQDNIIGVVHTKDFLRVMHSSKKEIAKTDIKSIIAKPWFIPKGTRLSIQLLAFRKRRNHVAFVVDEYGGVMGIVTLEDILEQIVGDIEDEHDVDTQELVIKSDGSIFIPGNYLIRDLNRNLEENFKDDDYSTIAGLIIDELEHIPEKNESFQLFDYKFTILDKQGNRITKIKLQKVKQDQTTTDGETTKSI